jgi:uncharacterized protein
MRFTLVAAAGLFLAMTPAWAEPSFDCGKAQSVSEREVCRVPALQWRDRQLARLYRDVKGKGGPQVVADQRTFLVRREACGNNIECLEQVYGERLKALGKISDAFDAAAEFRPTQFGGSLWVVRFGLTGAIQLLTVGDGGHTCVFETDNATQTGKGVLKAVEMSEDGTCRLNVIPNGNDHQIETHNCQSFCGMRAIMDGSYKRVGPAP